MKALIEGVVKEILAIDESKFNARMKLQFIHKFSQGKAFGSLSDKDIRELEEHIGPLIFAIDDDELAKRFDYLMYTIEYADLKGMSSSKSKNRVVSTADKLTLKGSIEMVKQQEALIYRVQTNEYWDEADIFDHEEVRKALRDLIKFIDSQSGEIYYTGFKDEIIGSVENSGNYSLNDMQNYRKKVNNYLVEHQNDLVVYKLRNNKSLKQKDIKYLEKILWQELGTKDDYEKEFGDEPLLKLVSKLVGLDPQAANDAFSDFLSDQSLTINQMEFVKLVVNYMIENGSLDKHVLTEHPFNKRGNVTHLFEEKLDVAKNIINTIDKLNERLSV